MRDPRGGGECGTVIKEENHQFEGTQYKRVLYKLYRCAGCGRAGLGKIHDNGTVVQGKLETFYPASGDAAHLPDGVPEGVEAEFREAELCAQHEAWRAASGMLRSTLEKTLRANGYKKGNLQSRIDLAADDGVITESRRKRAHEDIRVLGNDVLHDEWRLVTEDEYDLAHRYTQRVIEDLYDDRETVVQILTEKGRLGQDGDRSP